MGCCAGKQVSCSSLSPLLLCALRPAAPSGRPGPRKYASLVLGLSAGFILSGSLLHVPARHSSKGRGGGRRRRRTRGRMGGAGGLCIWDLGSAVYSQAELNPLTATTSIFIGFVSSFYFFFLSVLNSLCFALLFKGLLGSNVWSTRFCNI